MSGELRLGLRLARGRDWRERARGIATVGAHLIGAWIMLVVLAAVRAEMALPSYDGGGVPLLGLTVIATVGVPIMVLLATVARLSAALRDRRLLSLRVLGLTAARTRFVSAVEAGAGAVVGSLLGLIVFWATRPMVRGLDVSGRDWSTSTFAPWPAAPVLVVIGLPLVAVLVALVPSARQVSVVSRPAVIAPGDAPSLWRLLVLPVGLATVWASTWGDDVLSYGRFSILVAGGALSAIGLILVIPVFTHLLADVMLRSSGRPSLRIAARRLQVQPAGVSRIVAGLLVALFVVSGGRMVLGAFEDSAQYRAADRAAHDGPATLQVISQDVDPTRLAAELSSIDGVLGAYPAWQLMSGCVDGGACLTGFVGTCADLEAAVPDARGCRDDRLSWLDKAPPVEERPGPEMTWTTQDEPPRGSVSVETPARTDIITSDRGEYAVTDAMQAGVFIPRTTPGIMAVAEASDEGALIPATVQLDPRVLSASGLWDAARDIDANVEVFDPWMDDSYEFVTGLRSLTWAVAAVVLAVGLVGFAVSTVDRAVSRRAEMVSLQLVGTGRGVIRAAQWWEAAVPLVVGVTIAIAAGAAVGYGYLSFSDGTAAVPWRSLATLATISAAAAVGVAGLTVVACAPRIRPELIRRA